MDHTIFICTKNRSFYIRSVLEFYKKFEYKGNIIIGDDSDENHFNENCKIVSKFNSLLKIDHFAGIAREFARRPYRVSQTILENIKRIKTQYFSSMGDDDYYFPNVIPDGIKFLNNNSDYACYMNPEYKIFFNKDYKIIKFKWKPWFKSEFSDPLERCVDYAIRPNIAWRGICRSESLKKIFKISKFSNRKPFTRSSNFSFDFFDEELPWVFSVCASGKIFYEDKVLGTIRGEFDNPERITNIVNKNVSGRHISGVIFNLSEHGSDIALNQLHEDLCNVIKINNSKYSKEIISSDVWSIISKWCSKFESRFLNEKFNKIKKRSIGSRILQFYSDFIRRDKHNLKKSKNFKNFINFWNNFIDN